MRHQLIIAGLVFAVAPLTLAKDRPVTEDERLKLVAAVTAQGCSGGKMEFDDDGHFEVDDAKCNDGRKYDLEFDASFNLTKKKIDD